MRTTVTLDPDVEQILHEYMEAKHVSFKQALNDSIRRGAAPGADYVFETDSQPVQFLFDITDANRLADQLEDQHIIEKMRSGL